MGQEKRRRLGGRRRRRRNEVDEEDQDIMILNCIPKCFEKVESSNSNSRDKRLNYIPKCFVNEEYPNSNSKDKGLNYIPKCYERVESSNSKDKRFVCRICTDTKTAGDAFYISGCSHIYCSNCVAMYIFYKLEDNIINIGCPHSGCSGSLEAGFCHSILLPEVFERWSKALSEDVFNVSDKFFCPFADCGAFLINNGTDSVRNFECPNCNRMLCAPCKVPLHEGIECSEFKNLNRNEKGKDVMLMHLAKDTKWRRCPRPSCRFYVAKSGGCNIMKCCRCYCRFCYKCGRVILGQCNCYCYKRNSIFPDQQQKHIQSDFKGGVYTNGTFPNRNTIYLTHKITNILQSFNELK